MTEIKRIHCKRKNHQQNSVHCVCRRIHCITNIHTSRKSHRKIQSREEGKSFFMNGNKNNHNGKYYRKSNKIWIKIYNMSPCIWKQCTRIIKEIIRIFPFLDIRNLFKGSSIQSVVFIIISVNKKFILICRIYSDRIKLLTVIGIVWKSIIIGLIGKDAVSVQLRSFCICIIDRIWIIFKTAADKNNKDKYKHKRSEIPEEFSERQLVLSFCNHITDEECNEKCKSHKEIFET